MAVDDLPEIDPEAMARAEAALTNLSSSYLEWVAADLRALTERFALLEIQPEARAEHLRALFTIVHDMKGQATTFGYPLVTRIGSALCRLIESEGDVTVAVIGAHVDALTKVVNQRLRDDGGDDGRRLLESLGLE